MYLLIIYGLRWFVRLELVQVIEVLFLVFFKGICYLGVYYILDFGVSVDSCGLFCYIFDDFIVQGIYYLGVIVGQVEKGIVVQYDVVFFCGWGEVYVIEYCDEVVVVMLILMLINVYGYSCWVVIDGDFVDEYLSQ